MANGIIKLDTKKVNWLITLPQRYSTLAKSTLLPAIRNNLLTSWPALTTRLIIKHLLKRLTAVQGHMDQGFKNIRSTKPVKNDVQEVDCTLDQEKNNIITHDLCAQHSWRGN